MGKKVLYGNDPSILVALREKITELNNVKPPYDIRTDSGGYIRNTAMDVWQKEYQKAQFALNSYHSEQESYVLSDLHVTKGLAIKLVSLGFNEKCYRVFYSGKDLMKPSVCRYFARNYWGEQQRKRADENPDHKIYDLTAPTLSQVRDWFMEKFDVDFITSPKYVGGVKHYECIPVGMGFSNVKLGACKTLREAELQAFEYLCGKVKRLPYVGIKEDWPEKVDEEVCEVGPED